ncbi:hypothetical protein SPISAL_03245 [Spiribacter salinus M19-40]|uniref:Uncharacterized protein n=1 Tax=Spiribacter salinus M19-40 TaxID=1260251 RepID=R4VMF4_9GAMM|nr:hypothetical protein [Spiribacter salinus]AGM40743.1 hypothetical protein SPISAL_03245 [Spiribacter salinus M19-40]
MPRQEASTGSVSLLLLGIGLVLFVSPFAIWWSGLSAPWYLPFALWLGYIGVVAMTNLLGGRRDL